MAMYSALRDAFNDMNKMMIDKQVWDAQHEANVAKGEREDRLLEVQLQDASLKREVLKTQAERAMADREMRPLNIYEMGDRNTISKAMENPEAQAKVQAMVGDGSYAFSPADGQFYNAAGQPHMTNNIKIQTGATGLWGIIDQYDDVPNAMATDLVELTQARKKLVADRGSNKEDVRQIAQIAEADTKIAKIDAQIMRRANFLNPKSGAMMEHFMSKSKKQTARARWAQGRGLTELAADLNKSASKFSDAAMLAWKEMNNPPSKAGQGTMVEYFATANGVVGPDGKGGTKTFKEGESFKKRTSAADMGVQTLGGFSTSRIPKEKKGTDGATVSAGLTNYRSAYATGEKVFKEITLPSGQIVPKTGKNIKLYKAVNRLYATSMIKLKDKLGSAGVGPGDASLEADAAVAEVLETHRGLQITQERLDNAKYNKATKEWTVPGRKKPMSNKEFNAVKAQHAKDIQNLGYVPDFKIKFGITKEQVKALKGE